MSASANHAVFLSYASQDAAAVLRIAEALRASGAEVWFDKNELVGGDAWDAKIRGQIAACALFVPVISAATQARGEGYFRLEWKLAVDRSHLMAHDQPFLLPVVVDATADAAARVPPEFRAVQWTRLPGGETPEKFCERVGKLLGRESGTGILPVFSGHGQDARATSELVGASLDGARGRGRAAPRPKSSRSWLVPAIIGVVAVAALALWQPWKKSAPAVPPRPAAVAPSALSLTPAQQLVAKARTILEQGDELNRETYALAEELLVKAEALDVMEASAWVLHARVSASRIEYGLDRSAARYEALRMQTGRAVQLAPGSLDVQLAEVDAAIAFEQNIPAVILRLQALAVKHPDDWIIQDQLSQCYRLVGKLSEGLAANERALQLSPENPRLKSNRINFLIVFRRWAEAETAIAAMLQGRTGARLLVHDVYLKLLWSGDLAGAATAVRSWPAWFLLEDRGVVNAAYVALWNRDPGAALAAVRKFPRDYISDYLFTGPSAVLSAWANEAASNVESARADWRTVQQVAERQLRAAPGDPYALHWKAWALARLGDTPAATSILQQLLEKNYDMSAMGQFVGRLGGLAVTVGRTDLALAQIAQNPPGVRAITKTDLRLNPLFDPLRSDPRFQAVIDAAVGPPEKKEVVAAPAVMPNDKSVAVLAFANLSDDKGNEYFSDGISEELLNVLAKVPGLKVSARTSAFYFKGKQVPMAEIARQLGVAYVVEGSVRKAGDKVRITAQLIKAADGFHLWSDTFTRELKEVFAVQDEIAGLIAQNLQLKLGMKSAPRVVNPEAYALFLQGRAIINRGVPDDHAKGIQCFKDSLALDGGSALTWAWLATSYGTAAAQNTMPAAPAWALAREAVNRALALDPELVEGHYALGSLQFLADWDWARADASLQHALLLAPGDASTLGQASNLAAALGNGERAVQLGRQAVALDPLNYFPAFVLGKAYFRTGRYAEMEKLAEQMIAVNAAGRFGPLFLAFARLLQGRVVTAAQAAEQMEPGAFQLMCLALVRHAQGRGAESDAALNELKARNSQGPSYLIAEVYAYRGEPDRAFEWLEQCHREHDSGLTWLVGDPFMQSLHGDARWVALLKKMNLPNSPAQ